MKTSMGLRQRARARLRVVFFFLFLVACSLPTSLAAPPALVLVTANPDASPTPTAFQPIGNQVAVEIGRAHV